MAIVAAKSRSVVAIGRNARMLMAIPTRRNQRGSSRLPSTFREHGSSLPGWRGESSPIVYRIGRVNDGAARFMRQQIAGIAVLLAALAVGLTIEKTDRR